jgi:hypothetical protein
MLSWVAQYVLGVDRDVGAVRYAMGRFHASNLQYQTMDLSHLSAYEIVVLDRMGEAYVAMEVLEHLQSPESIIGAFKPLIWSMPVNDGSRFHARAYSVDEICDLLPGPKWVQNSKGLIHPPEFIEEAAYLVGITEEL